MDDLNEQDIQYYPLDFETLKKGDSIPPARLEQLTGKPQYTDGYNLAVLALRERIVRECRDRGKHFTVAIVKGAMRILTDEEAAVYNVRTFRAGFRRSGHSLRRLAKVNTAALSDPQKKEHERNLIVFGKMLQAARSARARTAIELSEHRRGVPGIPGEVGEGAGKVKEE